MVTENDGFRKKPGWRGTVGLMAIQRYHELEQRINRYPPKDFSKIEVSSFYTFPIETFISEDSLQERRQELEFMGWEVKVLR